jgi:hypothetical protein
MPIPDATATVTVSHWQALRDPPPAAPPGLRVARREVAVHDDGGALVADVRWWLVPLAGPTRLDQSLATGLYVDEAWVGGVAAPVGHDGAVVLDVTEPITLRVRGRLLGESVSLMSAATGTMRLPEGRLASGPGWVVGPDGVWRGAPGAFSVPRQSPTSPAEDVVVATVGVGLTVDDSAATWSTRVRWSALRGDLTRAMVDVPGLPADATWASDGAVTRVGDRVTVTPDRTDAAEVVLTWSVPAPDAETRLVVPEPRPVDVLRAEGALQIARVGEPELIPSVSATPAPAGSLPEWARDLIDGAPTASFVGDLRGTVDVLRYEPLPGPPIVVDVADWQVVADPDGRVLLRGLLDVRNDRAAWLSMAPPAGSHLLAVTVDREPVAPCSDGGGGWLLPVPRSVESVEGLLSFPVEIVLLVDGPTWARRRALTLPVLDAEVAVARTTIDLPRGWRRTRGRVPYEVDDFQSASGLTYGLASTEQAAAADDAYQAAVRAWLDNDFDVAQQQIDRLNEMGASNDNVWMLQRNLDVVTGSYDGDEKAARRIQEQAKARAFDETVAAEEALAQAETLRAAGDEAAAAESYASAAKVAKKLSGLDKSGEVAFQEVERRANEALSTLGDEDHDVVLVFDEEALLVEGEEDAEPEADEAEPQALTSYKRDDLAQHRADPFPPAIPTDRSFGASSTNENTYMLDGVNIPDPPDPADDVGGLVLSVDQPVVVAEPPMEAPAPEPVTAGVVLTKDFLQSIPTGRSYPSAVTQAAGVGGGAEGPSVTSEATGSVITRDLLESIPAERTFESAVASSAAVIDTLAASMQVVVTTATSSGPVLDPPLRSLPPATEPAPPMSRAEQERAWLISQKRLDSIAFLTDLLSMGTASSDGRAEMVQRLTELKEAQAAYEATAPPRFHVEPAPPRPPVTLTEFGVGGVTATRAALQMPVAVNPIRYEHLVLAPGTPLVLEIRSARTSLED